MVLSARYVKAPKSDKLLFCAHCEYPVSGPHVRLYGMAHGNEKPHTLRFHVDCISESVDISQEPKIKKALEHANGL